VHIAEKDKNTLRDFMNYVIKQSLIPKVRFDYKNQLDLILKESDAFMSSDCIPLKEISNDFTLDIPIFSSSLKLNHLIRELIKFAYAIPSNKTDFIEIIEIILKRYLDECNSQLISIIENKFCGECLLHNSNILYAFENLSDFTNNNKIELIIKELIDSQLYN